MRSSGSPWMAIWRWPVRVPSPTTRSRCCGLERERIKAGIDNDQSPESIQAKLIDSLPQIVAMLPKPTELKAVTIGGHNSSTVTGLLAELTAVVGALRSAVPPS